MSQSEFPPGWDEERVQQLIAHYDAQTEDEQLAEFEAMWDAEGVTVMAVPTELVPEFVPCWRGSRAPSSRFRRDGASRRRTLSG